MNVTTPCYYINQCSKPYLTNNYYNDIRFRNHINFAINTFATIIASFIIVYRSSKAMKMYRWFLLNIAIWSYMWDFNMTLFFAPVFLFPAPVICSLGISKDIFGRSPLAIGVPFSFLILTLSACGAALACALYYRYKLLNNDSTAIFTKKPFLSGMLLFHFVSGVPPLIAGLFSVLDKALDTKYWVNYIKKEFFRAYEIIDFCAHSYYINQRICICGGVVLETTATNIMLFVIFTELVLYFLLIVFGPLYIYYCLRKTSNLITQKKYDHEKKIILSLSMQSIIPVCCLAMPYIYIIIDLFFNLDNPNILTILVQISTLHSFFNAVTMILMLKPYREALKDALLLKCFKNRMSSTTSPLNHGNNLQVQQGNLQLRRMSRPIVNVQI